MSRLTDLITQAKAKDPELAKELEREFKILSSRRSFGLNFERHRPESVELPGRPVRKGDKVRVLPPRGETGKGDQRLWKVKSLSGKGKKRAAKLDLLYADEPESQDVAVTDLVVVAEFKDYIYPGLVSTGKVERGKDKPFHTVINGENFHALEALTFTHRGKIDAIYIDPPYNTGAKDWKYNNDYVDGEDLYRHSKWLAMMERRLKIAKQLLNPEKSVLIATIDEKEYLRLGLLLEQVFPEAQIQMISSVINPTGVVRGTAFARTDEYIFIVSFGIVSSPQVSRSWATDGDVNGGENIAEPYWRNLRRSGSGSLRSDRPNLYYELYIDPENEIVSTEKKKGFIKLLPIRPDGKEGRWQISKDSVYKLFDHGYIRLRKHKGEWVIQYLASGEQEKHKRGIFKEAGKEKSGALILEGVETDTTVATTQWSIPSHSARHHGAALLRAFLPGRNFPFPKSLYAVEDVLRFFVFDNKNSIILDFFSGSGTTAHAVMRLNKQDDGRRQCISITNNEVAAEEQKELVENKLRPGDHEWEQRGICDYVTKPRIEAAITGKTPEGKKIKGDYKFTDEFSMSEGFKENAEFFTLTYETPIAVSHNKAFARIAPLLWMRAGSQGKRIEKIPAKGWDVADTYGIITDLDNSSDFCDAVEKTNGVRIAYIVTDDDRRFQSIARQLPASVEAVRLYESYLNNFRFSFGR